jgi:hypothetical protein
MLIAHSLEEGAAGCTRDAQIAKYRVPIVGNRPSRHAHQKASRTLTNVRWSRVQWSSASMSSFVLPPAPTSVIAAMSRDHRRSW